jgi:hypothetical protein
MGGKYAEGRATPAVRDPFTPHRNVAFEAFAGSIESEMNPF